MEGSGNLLNHTHRCMGNPGAACGVLWKHSHNMKGDVNAHACPACGAHNWQPVEPSSIWRIYFNVNPAIPNAIQFPCCIDNGPNTERMWCKDVAIDMPSKTKFAPNAHPKMWMEVTGADAFYAGDVIVLRQAAQ